MPPLWDIQNSQTHGLGEQNDGFQGLKAEGNREVLVKGTKFSSRKMDGELENYRIAWACSQQLLCLSVC